MDKNGWVTAARGAALLADDDASRADSMARQADEIAILKPLDPRLRNGADLAAEQAAAAASLAAECRRLAGEAAAALSRRGAEKLALAAETASRKVRSCADLAEAARDRVAGATMPHDTRTLTAYERGVDAAVAGLGRGDGAGAAVDLLDGGLPATPAFLSAWTAGLRDGQSRLADAGESGMSELAFRLAAVPSASIPAAHSASRGAAA